MRDTSERESALISPTTLSAARSRDRRGTASQRAPLGLTPSRRPPAPGLLALGYDSAPRWRLRHLGGPRPQGFSPWAMTARPVGAYAISAAPGPRASRPGL